MGAVDAEAALSWTCRYCGVLGAIRIEERPTFVAQPVGTWALAGVQVKASAVETTWPWAVCRPEFGGCGHESRGQHDPGIQVQRNA